MPVATYDLYYFVRASNFRYFDAHCFDIHELSPTCFDGSAVSSLSISAYRVTLALI